MTNWLTSLQPGDEVIVVWGRLNSSMANQRESRTAEKVEKVSDKLIVVCGRKYRRDNGKRCGDWWGGRLERVGE